MPHVTLAQLKTYLGIAGTTDDARLEQFIQSASAAIDAHCRRTFSVTTATERVFTTDDLIDDTLYLDHELAELVSVTNGDGLALDLADIRTTPRNRAPYWKLTAAWDDSDDITITGYWGYSREAPADIVQATLRLAAYFYRQKDANNYEAVAVQGGPFIIPQGVPKDVLSLLEPYRRLV